MAGELIHTFRRTLAKIAEIESRMATDQIEIVALRGEIDELRKLLRSEAGSGDKPDQHEQIAPRVRPIRESSTVGQARRVLSMVGAPMHVNDIIKNIEHMSGLPVSKGTLVSNLARYVKAGDTFVRTGKNTFALIDDTKEIRLVG